MFLLLFGLQFFQFQHSYLLGVKKNISKLIIHLLKIHLNSKLAGYCLSIESDSVFPEEKELIIKPGTIFKLKSIHDDVELYLFNKNFSSFYFYSGV